MNSRVKRYSKTNRFKRSFKKKIKKIPSNVIRNLAYLFTGLIYALYLIIKAFDNLVANLFLKLPRIMKVIIIYLLVFNLMQDVLDIVTFIPTSKSVFADELNIKLIPINFENETKKVTCNFDNISCLIFEKGKELGLNDKQILISISISKHETGNYTSKAFKEKNNVGGVMCSSGLKTYLTLEEGITDFLNNLKNNYFNLGLDTLEKIQPKYCPIGAKNDPTGLNKNWLSGTTKYYNELISN